MRLKLLILVLLVGLNFCYAEEADLDKIFDMKQSAFALYNTGHADEAYKILINIQNDKRDEEVYLILANIEEEKNHQDKALSYLKAAIRKNPQFYKAYYNLGCIFMKRRIYSLAVDNFELALKYAKDNPYVLYNLGCAQLSLGEYTLAKKNFTKAILLKNDEKNFYYNLAYTNKKLGREKEAKKIIDFYNQTFVK